MKLRSIKAEAAACRKAWAAMPDATAGVHIHHETAAEALTEPIEHRIAYILASKPEAEQALRLRLMRPVEVPAWAEFERVRVAAWAEFERVRVAAWAEFERVAAPAWAEYQRVVAPACAEYQRVEAVTWAEYDRVAVPAWAEYKRVTAPAWAEYQRVEAAAWAEYKRVEFERVEAATHAVICPTPDCPWDGDSIFGGE